MGRARRARKIAATAAYGGGGVAAAGAALGAAGWGVIKAEAALARRIIGSPFDDSPDDNGVYGAGRGQPYDVVVLGDSSRRRAWGPTSPHETVGAIIASGVAALTGRRVRLTNRAVVGAESSDLERQLANALEDVLRPDVVLIMVGANDVTHRIERSTSVRQLEQTVRRIRALGSEVVVGTCPGPRHDPADPRSRCASLMKRWSRDLAAAQTVAVVEAGGRTVSLGDLHRARVRRVAARDVQQGPLPPVRRGLRPGRRRAAAERVRGAGRLGRRHQRPAAGAAAWRGRGPVAVAAGQAVKDPGTEVAPTEIAGQSRGPRGRWAVLLRRRPDDVPPAEDTPVEPTDAVDAPEAAGPA